MTQKLILSDNIKKILSSALIYTNRINHKFKRIIIYLLLSILIISFIFYIEDLGLSCDELIGYQNLKLRTNLYFFGEKYESKGDFDVTLVTQLNTERIYMLRHLCDHWSGPKSVALYVSEKRMSDVFLYVRKNITNCKNIAIHIGYQDKNIHLYPYNHLRNIALKQVKTPFVYLSDADLIPVKSSYQTIKNFLENRLKVNDYFLNQILVIPAFETFLNDFKMPENKTELINMWKDNKVEPFYQKKFIFGHRPTNYSLWKISSMPYRVQYEARYEPYFVVRSHVPIFEQRFAGFGQDKITHQMKLNSLNYSIWVHPNLFSVHIPHEESKGKIKYFTDRTFNKCVKKIREQFDEELGL